MSNVTITVTTHEGVTAYVPAEHGRAARWVHLRRRKDGSLKKGEMPKRLYRFLPKEKAAS